MRSAQRRLGPVELAQPVERGAPHAGLRHLQTTLYETAPLGFLKHLCGVEQPMDERIAVTRLERPSIFQKLVESRWGEPSVRAARPSGAAATRTRDDAWRACPRRRCSCCSFRH